MTKNSWKLGWTKATTPKASVSSSINDLNWLAGFLEGEGSFMRTKSDSNGHHGASEQVRASQVQREPLERLQRSLGGSTKWQENRTHPIHDWRVSGPRARGIMMTLYSFMSPKRREEIRRALYTS